MWARVFLKGDVKEGRTTLNLYLLKVARGDTSCMDKLVRRLADRILCLPVLSDPSSSVATNTKLNVYRYSHFGKEIIPVFTSEAIFENWRSQVSVGVEQVQLLGGDVCAAIGSGSWLSVDEGTEHAAMLDPFVVEKIAAEPIFDGEGLIGTVPPVIHETVSAVQEISEHLSAPQESVAHEPEAEAPLEVTLPAHSAGAADDSAHQIISGTETVAEASASPESEPQEPQPIYLSPQHIIRPEPVTVEQQAEVVEAPRHLNIQDWD